MYKTINVLSRKDMVKYSYAAAEPCVIVSISDIESSKPKFARNKNIHDVLYLQFEDLEDGPDCISPEEAKSIAEFVQRHQEENLDLYFHCEAGISRSAGCAAATMLVEFGDDSSIFNDGRYRPNMKCYRRVLDAFDITLDDVRRAREKRISYLQQKNELSSEFSPGVFWITDDGLLAFPFNENPELGKAKSGKTNNHKKVWEAIMGTKGKPYNYYPRGRVDIDNRGFPKIFANPNIDMDKWLPEIKSAFGIAGDATVVIDNSAHYKCHLDEM